jgi:heterodisulfide reductase subunit A-like polyferredoxin
MKSHVEIMDGDAEVAFVKVSRSMEKSPSTLKEAAPVHDGSCAAGDLCVEMCEFNPFSVMKSPWGFQRGFKLIPKTLSQGIEVV